MEETIVTLRSKRWEQADRFQTVRHAIAALSLILSSLDAFGRSGTWEPWLGGLDLAAGGALLAAAIRELKPGRRHDTGARTRIGWVDVFAGGVFAAEGLHRIASGYRYIQYPYLFMALASALLGIFHARFMAFRLRRRFVRVSDAGIEARLSPFRRFRVGWPNIEAVRQTDAAVVISTLDGGRYTIPLHDYENAGDIGGAVLAGARARGSEDVPARRRAAARLAVVPVHEGHITAVQRYASDPAVSAMTRIPNPYPENGASLFIQRAVQNRSERTEFVYAIEVKGDLVGLCGLRREGPESPSAELGYWIGKPFFGQGFASGGVASVVQIGFEVLGFDAITALCLERNKASLRVLEKNGFREVNREQNSSKHWDPADVIIHCRLTREEWRAARSAPQKRNGNSKPRK